MPTTKRDGLPTFWASNLAKVLVGEQPCQLAPWLAAHFNLAKRPRQDEGSLAVWKANHTAHLTAYVETLRADGWKCSVERFFRVTGASAVLTGKADCVAQQTDRRPLIVDVKSGQPKESDVAQVLIEMVAIPLAWGSDMLFNGLVVYPTHTVPLTTDDASAFKPKLFAGLRKLATRARPQASPSGTACRFCDVSDADCPDRWVDDVEHAVATTEF